MKKRKVKSDKFPKYDESYGPIKWKNQHDIVKKYAKLGLTIEFLAYNRSNQFRNRLTITEDDILPCKRVGAAGVLYRNDTTEIFVQRVFAEDNIIPFENKDTQTPNTPNNITPNTHNKKNTPGKIGQKS